MDDYETVNSLQIFTIFNEIYRNKYFVGKMIKFNMQYYEETGLFNYYEILTPSYNKTLERYKLYTYEKDGKILSFSGVRYWNNSQESFDYSSLSIITGNIFQKLFGINKINIEKIGFV